MTVQEVVKSVIKATGMTQRRLADAAGLSGQGAVSMYLKSKSMRVEALQTMLNACGYELVARDPSGKHPEFVIGDEVRPVAAAERDASDEDERLRAMVRKILEEEMGKSRG